jgi:hypothetical protein
MELKGLHGCLRKEIKQKVIQITNIMRTGTESETGWGSERSPKECGSAPMSGPRCQNLGLHNLIFNLSNLYTDAREKSLSCRHWGPFSNRFYLGTPALGFFFPLTASPPWADNLRLSLSTIFITAGSFSPEYWLGVGRHFLVLNSGPQRARKVLYYLVPSPVLSSQNEKSQQLLPYSFHS